MSELPNAIITVLAIFQPLFSRPVWKNAQLLLLGAILCPRERTIAAILRVLGLSNEKKFDRFHWVLSAANWSIFKASKLLLFLIIKIFSLDKRVEIVVDETLEKRKGEKIKFLGFYRDSCSSSRHNKVCRFGLRWLVFTVIVVLPWSKRKWALPFLTILGRPKKGLKSSKNPIDHNDKIKRKTAIKYTEQVVMLIRKWLGNDVRVVLVGDGAFACYSLACICKKTKVKFVSRLRWDAALYDFPKNESGRGRPKIKGKKLPKPEILLEDPTQIWLKGTVKWYGKIDKEVEYLSGKCLWLRTEKQSAPIRWIIIKDPKGEYDPCVIFETLLDGDLDSIELTIEEFVDRSSIEVTFQEVNSHLGFGTQRQWSNKAIERTTPCLLGIFSIVCILCKNLLDEKQKILTIQKTAWYKKSEGTFSDVIREVKATLWKTKFLRSLKKTECTKIDIEEVAALLLEYG